MEGTFDRTVIYKYIINAFYPFVIISYKKYTHGQRDRLSLVAANESVVLSSRCGFENIDLVVLRILGDPVRRDGSFSSLQTRTE